ncbi:MAG: hypothetical protein EU530_11060 [Promethearchaeota archaeon]|nr:MAG: hypothetical protein EU530_11060 [Candidatus Lokiarchaeota archaeon]
MAQTHFQGNNELYLRDFHMPIDMLEIKGIFGPSVYTEILEKVVGAATINDQLCLTLTSGKDIINRKLLEDELVYVKNLLITSLK